MQQFSTRLPWQFAHREPHGFELHAIKRREVVFVLQQEVHVASVHAIVDGGLDVKHVESFVNDLPLLADSAIELRGCRIHVAVGVANCLRIVM